MTTTLTLTDWAALSPLLILLATGLLVLLIESFTDTTDKTSLLVFASIGLVIALIAAFYSPTTHHPLLTLWLRFDGFTRFFTLFFLSIGLSCTLLSFPFFETFKMTKGEFLFLLLAATFGLILIGASADFLTLFLGLETLSLSLYLLCSYVKRWEISYEAAIKYFLIGAAATALFLYGIALIYGALGTMQFHLLLRHYQSLSVFSSTKPLFLGGIALVTLGLAFKAAVVPFHVWAPDVYSGASTPVTAFMAVGTKVGAFAGLARLFLEALPQLNPLWNTAMTWIAYLTLIYANIVAIRQVQLRRFFAYSGIAHAGFLLIPLIVGTAEALPALTFYLIIYSLATLGSFAILSLLDHTSQGVMLHDLQGLFQRSPFLAGIFALCLLTLAGIPPTVGFFAKFYIFKLAFQAGYIGLVIVGLLMTILSAFYYLRMISVMLTPSMEKGKELSSSSPATIVGSVAFALIIILSFYPSLGWIGIDFK
jgi:NADH-quinone oxidoreductase subunit N